MGHIYKRGPTYWARYADSTGAPQRHSLRTTDRAVALQRLREAELTRPTDRAANTPLKDQLKHLLEVVYAGRSKGTVDSYTQKGRHLIRILGAATPIGALDRAVLQRYRAARLAEGAHAGSIHKEFVVLRLALREASIEGVVPRVSAEYTPRDSFLEPEVFAGVLQHLAAKRRLWLMVAAYLGVRDSELNALQWPDVDLKRATARVRGTKTATSFRQVPIAAPLLPWLQDAYAAAGPVVPPWLNRRRDICIAYWKATGIPVPKRGTSVAGLPRISPNDLRRTFASWLKQAGADSLAVAHLLGHSSTRMVELVYGRLNAATYRATVALLPRVPTE